MPDHAESARPHHEVPTICEDKNSKSLHFSNTHLQSRMRTSQPDELELDYTKTMMGFLRLQRQPRHIAMIGLGGGSLAKYCYRQLPETKITVVEINPHVIAMRQEFLVPDDNERFQVIEADGADFVRDAEPDFDVLLVDGYDQQGQPAALCSQHFYENCCRVLADPGVMAVNLHGYHRLYELFIDRINRSFGNNTAEVPANRDGNVIVFAGKNIPVSAHAMRGNVDFDYFALNERKALHARVA
ncbi:fused MFS/spermidine synthase [Rhodoferax ferrireducens]|uniref:fused MFS/spermidine synthase n=1 Tax=Rhodoferax ferrireducens TaxID=192843 RepID=UPI000E0D175E|nr:fused MFS/spermidine synthase [Rhodoferax ferrireducens]